MSLRLAGKHCAIVGASGIIGSSIARTFAREGAVLTLLGRTPPDVLKQRLQPDLTPYKPPEDAAKDVPSEHRFVLLDATSSQSCQQVFQREFPKKIEDSASDQAGVGKIDVLVNCAGITQTSALKRTGDEALEKIIDTNLLATMLACKHAKMRDHGCIINVSSLMATKGGRGAAAYAASKAGVVGFTRALCDELSLRRVRINALLPGWVKSQMWDQLQPRMKEEFLAQTPLRRVAEPAEIADAALFLATNKFANNCVLNIDGGLSST